MTDTPGAKPDLHEPVDDPRFAAAFRRLHERAPLILPNAWDAASAAVIASCGASAVATTSGGLAWALGFPDGESADFGAVLDAVARICAAVDLPVTVDLERGFGAGPNEVGASVGRVLQHGAAGFNVEDSTGAGLRPDLEQAERLSAARQAADAVPGGAFLNARADTFLLGGLSPDDAFSETVRRGVLYADAGADGLFVPGVTDMALIAQLRREVPLPLNVMAHRGAPPVRALAAAGATRISVGTALAEVAYSSMRMAAQEFLEDGTFEALRADLGYGEMNALFH